MNALVINCSPVKNGATAEIVNVVFNSLKEKYDVRNICIDDYDFNFCKGCRVSAENIIIAPEVPCAKLPERN